MFGLNSKNFVRIIAIVVAALLIFGMVAAILVEFLMFVIPIAVIGAVIYLILSRRRGHGHGR
ncbi:MAG: hypothetical protein FWH55_00740 [Oscillospiraceae bacterium]|nr:hypothetical protein [Oscillospiraceae bacterium]